jgi:Tfp pilus assembly protein PilP
MNLPAAALILAVAGGAMGVAAQPAPAANAPAAPATTTKPANPADAPPTPPSNYAYAPEGRRDPFVSLFNRGTTGQKVAPGGTRAEGPGGILVEEVAVRGIFQSRGTWVAMIAAPSGRTYSIRPGDRLMDGSVRTINAQAVVLMQEVNDPLSLEKQREVRKYLRGEVK